jgi:hypothetical protein
MQLECKTERFFPNLPFFVKQMRVRYAVLMHMQKNMDEKIEIFAPKTRNKKAY